MSQKKIRSVLDFPKPIIAKQLKSFLGTVNYFRDFIRNQSSIVHQKNRNSRLLGHVNFDGQNHRFIKKGSKNGFIYGFGHYFPDFGYLGFGSECP